MRDGIYGEFEKKDGKWINHGVFGEDEPKMFLLNDANLGGLGLSEQEIIDMDYDSLDRAVKEAR